MKDKEIVDGVRAELNEMLRLLLETDNVGTWEGAVDQILNIENLAIVDRGYPELPKWALSEIGSELENALYRVSQKDMKEAGYVKEIKWKS